MKIGKMNLPDSVSILGTEYKIRTSSPDKDPKMNGNLGYTELCSKEIYLKDSLFDEDKDDVLLLKNFEAEGRKVIRHEIVHAFILESGLCECCSWADDEMLVDWIARQFPKMQKCFEDIGVDK